MQARLYLQVHVIVRLELTTVTPQCLLHIMEKLAKGRVICGNKRLFDCDAAVHHTLYISADAIVAGNKELSQL